MLSQSPKHTICPKVMYLQFMMLYFVITIFSSCSSDIDEPVDMMDVTYSVSGTVINESGEGLSDIELIYNTNQSTITNNNGSWAISNLSNNVTIKPTSSVYVFEPAELSVSSARSNLTFTAMTIQSQQRNENVNRIINWFEQQQRANGLIESAEGSNFVSLYDNALAAMVFINESDFTRAERIFDFFNNRIDTELKVAPGGFHWFRNAAGEPYDNRWVGDNAWLLIALNNYKAVKNDSRYDRLIDELTLWIQSLQQSDGGILSGYTESGNSLNYVITEGVIDAFNAVPGYDDFHRDILTFLKNTRWDVQDRALIAWPNNPNYKYSIDNQSWGFLMFEDFPVSVLSLATDKLLNTQTSTLNNMQITGFDIDEDRDAVFIEGTGQMATAYKIAGLDNESEQYIKELEKLLIESDIYTQAMGLPYTVNIEGTFIEKQPYWEGADTEIAASTGAWYIFAIRGFNPLAVERNKGIATTDKFWLN